MNFTHENIKEYVSRFRKINTEETLSTSSIKTYVASLNALVTNDEFQYVLKPEVFLKKLKDRGESTMAISAVTIAFSKLLNSLTKEELEYHFPDEDLNYARINGVMDVYRRYTANDIKQYRLGKIKK